MNDESITRVKLSAMMFLQYFVWGAWYVTMGTWLGETLHFSGEQIGLAFGTTALAAMISPFFVGMVADRFFATERILAALHVVGGVVLFFASTQTTLRRVLRRAARLHALLHADAGAEQLAVVPPDDAIPAREFPPIRVLGTIGWIVAGLAHRHARARGDGDAAADRRRRRRSCSALFCLALPHTPPLEKATASARRWADILGLDALKLLRERSFADVRARVVPDLHPAAVLLRVRQPVPERAARDATRPAR